MPTRLSYYHGVCTEQLIGATIGDHFSEVAAQNADRLAVVDCHQDVEYSYKEFKKVADNFARGLIKLGVKRGDRIAIWSTNSIQWLITFFGTVEAGAVLVNVNPAYRLSELEYALNHSGAKVLVVIPEFKTSNYLQMIGELMPESNGKEKRLPGLEHIIVIGEKEQVPSKYLSFDDVLASGSKVAESELAERMASLQFDDAINIQYTSGTTGQPKGVTLSHHNILNNAVFAARQMELDNTVKFCVPVPFYHCAGLIVSALSTISVGGAVIIPGPFFNDEEALKAVQEHKCTHTAGVPTMFIAQLEHPDFKKYDMSSLRGGFMAGAPCPVQAMKRAASEMNMSELVILYGLTEAAPLITGTSIRDSLEARTSTVGRAIPGIEVKIIDVETDQIVPIGTQGEVCSRGHGVMLGYWDNAEATEAAIDCAGWLHTGDLGVMREDGLVNITGRKKDMIIRGGENVYPKEIEDVLLDHSAIAQAQVFGIPDELKGEEVAAWVTLKHGAKVTGDELKTWLKEKISFFKVPKHINIVEEFPMTVSGKPQKFVMRDLMITELGLHSANEIPTA